MMFMRFFFLIAYASVNGRRSHHGMCRTIVEVVHGRIARRQCISKTGGGGIHHIGQSTSSKKLVGRRQWLLFGFFVLVSGNTNVLGPETPQSLQALLGLLLRSLHWRCSSKMCHTPCKGRASSCGGSIISNQPIPILMLGGSSV